MHLDCIAWNSRIDVSIIHRKIRDFVPSDAKFVVSSTSIDAVWIRVAQTQPRNRDRALRLGEPSLSSFVPLTS